MLYREFLAIVDVVYCRNAPGMVKREEFEAIIDSVDAVSLMTYDYSHVKKYVIYDGKYVS